jgi:hypothetical protein
VAEASGGNPRKPSCGDVRILETWAGQAPPLTLP